MILTINRPAGQSVTIKRPGGQSITLRLGITVSTEVNTANLRLGRPSMAAAGRSTVVGTSAAAFGRPAFVALGAGISGTLSASIGRASMAASGLTIITASAAEVLGKPSFASAGSPVISGTAAEVLGKPVFTAAGGASNFILSAGSWNDSGVWVDSDIWNDGPISGSIAEVFGKVSLSASGMSPVTGIIDEVFGKVSFAASNGSTYDADAQAYFAAMTTQPDSTRKGLINDLIVGLKADGAWSLLDWFVLYASHDSQSSLINARVPSKTVTMSGTITFTADRGWTGDGSTGYGSIGEVANAAGNQYSQNSASKGAYCNLSQGTAGVAHFGVSTDTTARIIATSGAESFSINDTSSGDSFRAGSGTASTARLGHRVSVRGGATDKRGYYNGALVSTKTSASTAVSTGIPVSHRSNTTYSNDRVACIWLGGAMTDTQANAVHNRLHTYLTAIGANY